MANTPAYALTTISGGINRLRTKGGADKNSLYELLNGYVTQSSTVKVRPGTFRNANIAAYAGAGTTKGLLSYQSALHIFSSAVAPVPPGYALHVLNHPASSQTVSLTDTVQAFATGARIGTNANYGLVSAAIGFAINAIITPAPGANIGSMSPTTFAGATIAGFFQATAASPSDPNQVYLVLGSTPALPATGVTIYYPNTSGSVTAVTLGSPTNVLGLGAAYAVYALGTVTPQYGGTSLLLHFDGSFADASSFNFAVTVNGGASTGTPAKFGSASFKIPASGPYLTIPIVTGGPLDIGTGDFTVELWINNTANIGEETLFSICQTNTNSQDINIRIGTAGNGTLGATIFNAVGASFNSGYVNGTYSHIALSVQGNTGYLYRDGVLAALNANIIGGITGRAALVNAQLVIGAIATSAGPSGFTVGAIDEVRITKGIALYTTPFTPPASALAATANGATLQITSRSPYPIKEIHFAAPYLGGIYVVAEFSAPAPIAAQYGSVFHYWIQSSTGGDNSNAWKAKTDYRIGDVVIPTSANGLTYVASRHLPANPVWAPNTAEAVNNVVEPITPNGFQYAATAVLGANPTTGAVEPTWPTVDGGVVNENSALAVDQTITLATAANTVTTPATPARYTGIAGGFKPGG